jgi:hypothetical protein
MRRHRECEITAAEEYGIAGAYDQDHYHGSARSASSIYIATGE